MEVEKCYRPLKVVVTGDYSVGKFDLLKAYTTGTLPEEYTPQVFSGCTATHRVGDREYELVLWDTTGQEEYERLRPLSYPNTDVFLLCFALNDRASFEHVTSKWLPELHHFCPKTPIILVGTNKDTRDLNVLSPEDVKELCEKAGLSKYVECSAKTHEGVQEVFTTAIMAVVNQKPNQRRRFFKTIKL